MGGRAGGGAAEGRDRRTAHGAGCLSSPSGAAAMRGRQEGGSWWRLQCQLKPYLVQGPCRRSYTLLTMPSTIEAIREGLIEALGAVPRQCRGFMSRGRLAAGPLHRQHIAAILNKQLGKHLGTLASQGEQDMSAALRAAVRRVALGPVRWAMAFQWHALHCKRAGGRSCLLAVGSLWKGRQTRPLPALQGSERCPVVRSHRHRRQAAAAAAVGAHVAAGTRRQRQRR